jgi:hypothetical protein
MAKSMIRIKARELRKAGKSIKEITETLSISKASVSVWCRDIVLTSSQIQHLHKKMVEGGYAGRLKGAEGNKKKKQERIEKYRIEGIDSTKNMTTREILMLGLGLYLGEGSKTHNQVRLSNSDPRLIKIFIQWAETIFGVTKENITCRVLINKIHKKRIEEVERQWSTLLNIPLKQFRKTTLVKSKNKKKYANHEIHIGTLAVSIQKSSDMMYRILGLTEGVLHKNSGMFK